MAAPPAGFMIESRPSWGGVPYPRRQGLIPARKPTPRCDPNLQPGALVRIKSYQEILSTLDGVFNRGLSFDAEHVPYCEKVYRVNSRVENFIDEKTGKMRHLRTPAVTRGCLLRLAVLVAAYVLPPAIYPRWRENCFNESPTASHCTATLAQGTYYKRACRRRRARRIVPRMFSSSFRKFIAGPQPVSCSSGPFASASPRMPAQFLRPAPTN